MTFGCCVGNQGRNRPRGPLWDHWPALTVTKICHFGVLQATMAALHVLRRASWGVLMPLLSLCVKKLWNQPQNPGQSPIFLLMGILWAYTSCSLTWLSRVFRLLTGYGFNETSRSFRNFFNDFVLTFYHCLCWAWIDCLYWKFASTIPILIFSHAASPISLILEWHRLRVTMKTKGIIIFSLPLTAAQYPRVCVTSFVKNSN